MARGIGEYVRGFFRNLYTEMPYGTWWKKVVTNRSRALLGGCCGHRGEPGC